MAQITDGIIKLYKTAGPSQQEKKVMAGPVEPIELYFRQNTSTGERFLLKNGFALHEDEVIIITFEHETKVSVVASLKLKLECLQSYVGLNGQPVKMDFMLTQADTTNQVNVITAETEISRYQVPKGVSLAFRVNDQFYLYLADA